MTDLVSDTPVLQSPKRKFSFRFSNTTTPSTNDKCSNIASQCTSISSNTHALTNLNKGRNFSEEIKNVPDLQVNFHCFFFYDLVL